MQKPGNWPLPLALLALLLGPMSQAQAHRLEGGAVIQPGWQIQVESWYETGESARGARIQVLDATGQQVAEGRANQGGIFIFSYMDVRPLRVIVNAGAGHRVELPLSAESLQHNAVCTAVACLQPTPAPILAAPLLVPMKLNEDSAVPRPVVERDTGVPIQNLAIGVGILLAIAMLAMAWQKWRQPGTIQER